MVVVIVVDDGAVAGWVLTYIFFAAAADCWWFVRSIRCVSDACVKIIVQFIYGSLHLIRSTFRHDRSESSASARVLCEFLCTFFVIFSRCVAPHSSPYLHTHA